MSAMKCWMLFRKNFLSNPFCVLRLFSAKICGKQLEIEYCKLKIENLNFSPSLRKSNLFIIKLCVETLSVISFLISPPRRVEKATTNNFCASQFYFLRILQETKLLYFQSRQGIGNRYCEQTGLPLYLAGDQPFIRISSVRSFVLQVSLAFILGKSTLTTCPALLIVRVI